MVRTEQRAVVFDWNGTLNDMGVLVAQDIALAREFGRELTPGDVQKLWGQPAPEFYPNLIPDSGLSWQELRNRFFALDDLFPKRLQPHALSALAKLARAGTGVALVTSVPRQNVEGRYMAEMGLPTGTFDFMHFGEESQQAQRQGRPRLATVVEEFGRRDITPERIVLVGDEENDFDNARAAGVGFVAVTNGVHSAEALAVAGVPPERMMPDLSHLPGILGIEPPR